MEQPKINIVSDSYGDVVYRRVLRIDIENNMEDSLKVSEAFRKELYCYYIVPCKDRTIPGRDITQTIIFDVYAIDIADCPDCPIAINIDKTMAKILDEYPSVLNFGE